MAVHDYDPSSKSLWYVELMPDGGRGSSKFEHFVWSDTPDEANKLGVQVWSQFDPREMDSTSNIDGSATEKGECYQGFACIECGAGSMSVFVNSAGENPYMFGSNNLKRILKSRGLDISTPSGVKGNAAKQIHGDRLLEYLSPPSKKISPESSSSVLEPAGCPRKAASEVDEAAAERSTKKAKT